MFLAVRLDHLSVDEQAVPRLDLDVVDHFGRGCVLEDLPRQLGRLLLGDRHQSIVKQSGGWYTPLRSLSICISTSLSRVEAPRRKRSGVIQSAPRVSYKRTR